MRPCSSIEGYALGATLDCLRLGLQLSRHGVCRACSFTVGAAWQANSVCCYAASIKVSCALKSWCCHLSKLSRLVTANGCVWLVCSCVQELTSMRAADATAKALIFSSFQATVEHLQEVLPGWGYGFRYINGETADRLHMHLLAQKGITCVMHLGWFVCPALLADRLLHGRGARGKPTWPSKPLSGFTCSSLLPARTKKHNQRLQGITDQPILSYPVLHGGTRLQ